MALSEDQKAILRLLAQRGEQGYEDLSALMGIEVAQVHARALEAAAQLESEGIPAPAIPPPPGVSASPPPTKPEPAEAPAPRVEQSPAPPAPELPKAEKPLAEPAVAPASTSRQPRPALPKGGGARAAIAAGALVLVALVVILIVGGGDDSGDSTGAGSGSAAETVNTNGGNAKEVTQAVLDPVGGGDARGVATFGRVKNSLALQVEANGLEPTGKGESYTVWLYESPTKMLPLASTRVGESGEIGVQVEVPTEVLGYLANEAFDQIDISLTENAALKASLEKATSEKKAPIYTGTDVLRGRITGPIIGAAKK